MAPRQAAKTILRKGRKPQNDNTLAGIAPTTAASQTDFRAIVAAKNEQRKEKLDAQVGTKKRASEGESEQEAKKTKGEESI
jgi:hypothetical protein